MYALSAFILCFIILAFVLAADRILLFISSLFSLVTLIWVKNSYIFYFSCVFDSRFSNYGCWKHEGGRNPIGEVLICDLYNWPLRLSNLPLEVKW